MNGAGEHRPGGPPGGGGERQPGSGRRRRRRGREGFGGDPGSRDRLDRRPDPRLPPGYSRPGGTLPAGASSARPDGRRSLPALLVLLLALAALLAGTVAIFLPFVAPITIALVAIVVAYPLFTWILRKVGEARRGVASFLTCTVLLLMVFAPAAWVTFSLIKQAPEAIEFAKKPVLDLLQRLEGMSFSSPKAQQVWDDLTQEVRDLFEPSKRTANERNGIPGDDPQASRSERGDPQADKGRLLAWIGTASQVLSRGLSLVVKAFLTILILFFFLKDGPPLLRTLQRRIPLDISYQKRVVEAFTRVSRSFIRGSVLTALAQGFVATVAFTIVGIPALFWGTATAFCALIPPIGTALTMVPLIIFFVAQAAWWKAMLLALVAVGVGLMDNVLKPLLMRDGVRMHPLWILLAILGGLSAFGPMGLIYGPMVLVLLGTFLTLFMHEESVTPAAAAPPRPAAPAPPPVARAEAPAAPVKHGG